MRSFVNIVFSILVLLVPSLLLAARDGSVSLTIYSKSSPGAISADMYRPFPGDRGGYGGSSIPGYAIVRHQRSLPLKQRINNISFTDIAALLDPTTVMFKSLTHPKQTKVVEQNYKFDLVSQEALLQRFLDKEIEVEQVLGDGLKIYRGTLLSVFGSGLVLKDSDGKLITLNSYSNIIFPELPEEFVVRPTLSWLVSTAQKGKHDVEVSYRTSALTWWSDYNLVYQENENDANKGYVDVNAWVSIINQSGMSYEDAKLKVVAGDVQMVSPSVLNRSYDAAKLAPVMLAESAAPAFQQKAFFEYHLYTLDTPTTLPNNSTKQLELFSPVYEVPVKKHYLYDQRKGNKVGVYIEFMNDERHDLGIPMPAGRVRVSKRDEEDGNLEFIGESTIDHTPKNEKVNVKLGNAFDVIAERNIMHNSRDNQRRTSAQTIEITLKNRKDESIKVNVVEALSRYQNWNISGNSHSYKRKSAYEVEFLVKLNPMQERKLKYTVQYRW